MKYREMISDMEGAERLDDHLLSVEREGERYYIELESFDQLEEDLTQMPQAEGLLSEKRRSEIKSEALDDVLSLVGRYLDAPDVEKAVSGFKVFILSNDDYFYLRLTLDPYLSEKQIAGKSAFITGSPREIKDSPIGPLLVVNPSGRTISVFNEQTGKKLGDTDKDDVKSMENYLRNRIRHEFLHALGVGENFPEPVLEGIVEFYAIEAGQSRDENLQPGYYDITKFVGKLVEVLESGGILRDNINKALVAQNERSLESIRAFLIEKCGEKAAGDLLNFRFKAASEALTALQVAKGVSEYP